MPFLSFVYGYPSSSPHAHSAHCTHNKSVPTLRCTCRHGPIYTGPCPKALTECSPLDFRRSSIKRCQSCFLQVLVSPLNDLSRWCSEKPGFMSDPWLFCHETSNNCEHVGVCRTHTEAAVLVKWYCFIMGNDLFSYKTCRKRSDSITTWITVRALWEMQLWESWCMEKNKPHLPPPK